MLKRVPQPVAKINARALGNEDKVAAVQRRILGDVAVA